MTFVLNWRLSVTLFRRREFDIDTRLFYDFDYNWSCFNC